MPFELANAPAVFQRRMDTVLGPLKNSVAFPHIDIIIPPKTVQEGMERLRQVLNVLREHKLTLKFSKCAFFKSTIELLGRRIFRTKS